MWLLLLEFLRPTAGGQLELAQECVNLHARVAVSCNQPIAAWTRHPLVVGKTAGHRLAQEWRCMSRFFSPSWCPAAVNCPAYRTWFALQQKCTTNSDRRPARGKSQPRGILDVVSEEVVGVRDIVVLLPPSRCHEHVNIVGV